MTVGAAPIEEEDRCLRPRGDRVLYRHMALGAEPGVRDFEQPVIDGSVGLMAVGATFKRRGMRPEKRSAPFGMTGVTVFVDAGLLELRRIWRAVRVMTVGTGELSFPERHVGRAVELRLSLRVTLTANFYFRPPVEERCLLTNLYELKTVGRFLHQGMTGDTGKTSVCVGTRRPIGLDAPLMASEAGSILNHGRLPRIFSKRNESAYTASSTGRDVIASWPVAILARLFLSFVSGIEQKDFPHHGLGKFFKLRWVAGFANFAANVRGGRGLWRFGFSGPDDPERNRQQ